MIYRNFSQIIRGSIVILCKIFSPPQSLCMSFTHNSMDSYHPEESLKNWPLGRGHMLACPPSQGHNKHDRCHEWYYWRAQWGGERNDKQEPDKHVEPEHPQQKIWQAKCIQGKQYKLDIIKFPQAWKVFQLKFAKFGGLLQKKAFKESSSCMPSR